MADPRKPDPPEDQRPTSAQLREEIDRGHMGDKVNAEDPSAVPLGTDDEAAGTPPSAEALEQEMARKRRTISKDERTSSGMGPVVWLLLIAAAAALLIGLFGLMG